MLRMPCREAARLLSEAQDRSLPARERWPLGLHLLACQHCRNYEAQLQFLRRAARHRGGEPGDDTAA